jgi:hypothetical protein
MSIRLDPRRLTTLKQLAAEADVRPGDLVRRWVEERVDAARHGVPTPEAATDLAARLAELAERVAALEASSGVVPTPASEETPTADVALTASDDVEPVATKPPAARARAKRVSAKPASERVALHDEMIAVLGERGPMSAGELAAAVAERGRYAPPRSGKPLDAAMISQRVSNPTYRSRFTRNGGRIGLAEPAG